jgi:hypothetical protein
MYWLVMRPVIVRLLNLFSDRKIKVLTEDLDEESFLHHDGDLIVRKGVKVDTSVCATGSIIVLKGAYVRSILLCGDVIRICKGAVVGSVDCVSITPYDDEAVIELQLHGQVKHKLHFAGRLIMYPGCEALDSLKEFRAVHIEVHDALIMGCSFFAKQVDLYQPRFRKTPKDLLEHRNRVFVQGPLVHRVQIVKSWGKDVLNKDIDLGFVMNLYYLDPRDNEALWSHSAEVACEASREYMKSNHYAQRVIGDDDEIEGGGYATGEYCRDGGKTKADHDLVHHSDESQ